MGFPKSSPTNEGKKLLLRALAGEQLQFSTIKIGDGKVTDNTDVAGLTGLINELHSFNIASIKKEAGSVTLYAPFDSREVAESFEFREIGVFALDPETKQEVLYSYTNCGEQAEKIEGVNVDFVEKNLKIIIAVNDAQNVKITINSDLNYVPRAEFDDSIKALNNNKVDKVSGKSLSTNDYTNAEKTKLSGIATGANKTVVDTALNSKSTNPVQNKVLTAALATKCEIVKGNFRGENADFVNTETGVYENRIFAELGYRPKMIIIGDEQGNFFEAHDAWIFLSDGEVPVITNFYAQDEYYTSLTAHFSGSGVILRARTKGAHTRSNIEDDETTVRKLLAARNVKTHNAIFPCYYYIIFK